MSEERDLTLNYHLKTDGAERQSRSYHQSERQRINDTAEAILRANAKSVAATNEQKRAQDQLTSSVSSTIGVVGGLTTAFTAATIGKKIFDGIRDSAAESHREISKIAAEVLKVRDAGRELAGVMGKKADFSFTKDQLKFGAMTGQNPNETREFRTSFQGEAQQFKDRFAPGEFEKYEIGVARMQVKEMIDPAEAGALGAQGIRTMPKGAKNLKASDVLGNTEQGFGILQAGSGSNPVLSRQLSKIIAGGVGEGEFFRDEKQAAVAIRTQAQYSAQNSGMHLQAIQRGIDQLDPKERMRLGLTDGQDYFQSMDAINAAYQKSGSRNLNKFLMDSGFSDERTRRGMRTHINEGINGGVISAGFKDAANFNAADYEAGLKSFFKDTDQAGSLRVAEGKTRLEAAGAAGVSQKASIAAFLEEGKAETEAKRLDASAAKARWLGGYFTPAGLISERMGFESSDELLQYSGAVSVAERRARQAGVKLPGPSYNQPNALGIPAFELAGKEGTEKYLADIAKSIAEVAAMTKEANAQRAKVAEPAPKPLNPGGPPRMPARP